MGEGKVGVVERRGERGERGQGRMGRVHDITADSVAEMRMPMLVTEQESENVPAGDRLREGMRLILLYA